MWFLIVDNWQAGVYFGWPPLCMLASHQVKRFLAKKTFGNSCVYVMSTLCNILLLIFLFMSAGSESSNWLELVMFKNDFVKTSRYLFGRSHLGFERFNYFDLTRPIYMLIFLLFVSGILQIILTHYGWNCKIFRDKLVHFWNSSSSSLHLDIQILTTFLTSEPRHLIFFKFF